MTAEETLKHWRENLSCEEQVRRQLAEEIANADTLKEMDLLSEIWILIYGK